LAVVLDGARLATQLTTLFLNDNALTSFPVALARLGQLRELHMHYNHLTTLPPEIGDFAHLEKLFLSHNALVSLPPEIGRLTSLQVRAQALPAHQSDLYSPHDTTRHDTTRHDTPRHATPRHDTTRHDTTRHARNRTNDTQTLSLFNNKLTSVPPELGQLRSLHSLFLNDNALTSLPPQMFDALAGTLTVLQLNANRLSSLPAQIGRLSGLRKLNIEANALVTVPASLALLTDLSVLAFRRNLFHYAVGGTWNVSPPTLLHLACAAVRCHIRALSLPSSSSSSSLSSSLSLSPAVEEVLSSASPLSTSTPPSPPEATSPITAIYDRPRIVDKNDKNADHHDGEAAHDGVMSTLAMVQGLNITEELKKLLLEGESACSVCGKLLYGDGHVVRVFPMELTPSVSGGGLSLSLTAPADTGTATAPAGTATATTGQTGTAALAAPPTPAAGGGGGGGLLTAIPPHRCASLPPFFSCDG
jgi:leucine-rich repeat protein SHOC2